MLESLKERAATQYISPFRFAAVYAALGELDQSFEWLERAYEQRDTGLLYLNLSRFSATVP